MRNLGLQLATTLLLVLTINDQVNCGRILIISPAPSFSHHTVYHGLATELHKRGHEIVILTANPKKDAPSTNYTQIDFSQAYEIRRSVNRYLPKYKILTPLDVHYIIENILVSIAINIYKHPEIQKLYKTDGAQKFDVVVVESLAGHAPMALAYKWKVPLIGLQSAPLQMYDHYMLGSPILPSHPSNWEYLTTTGNDVSLWTKIQNYILMLRILYFIVYVRTPKQTAIAREALGDDIPSVMDIAKNMSVFLAPFDPLIDEVMLLPPNVIPITGFQILEKPPPLPRDMAEFLGNATNGFVYMSLGTNMKSSMMPKEKVMQLYNAFSQLPCRVLWKFEADYLPKKKGNIFTSNWIPQQSVLAHPNIKVFIFQGGLQSTEETVYYGVPVVGVPVMFDQIYRIRKLMALGVGRSLSIEQLEGEEFFEAIFDVLTNERYKMNMMELRKRMHDKPYNSKQNAVWWVEYVMRHKSAAHLRYSEAEVPFYQRDNMDVIACLSITLFLATIVFTIVLIQSARFGYRIWLQCTTGEASSTLKDKKVE